MNGHCLMTLIALFDHSNTQMVHIAASLAEEWLRQ